MFPCTFFDNLYYLYVKFNDNIIIIILNNSSKLLFMLQQRPYVSNSYNTAWSPPAQSNETANGYFLERSNSARKTLELACELVPEEVTNTVNNVKYSHLTYISFWHIGESDTQPLIF